MLLRWDGHRIALSPAPAAPATWRSDPHGSQRRSRDVSTQPVACFTASSTTYFMSSEGTVSATTREQKIQGRLSSCWNNSQRLAFSRHAYEVLLTLLSLGAQIHSQTQAPAQGSPPGPASHDAACPGGPSASSGERSRA